MLLEARADADAHTLAGDSPLGLAAARRHHAVIRALLLVGGARADRPSDEHGWTPMHDAARSGDQDAALALLRAGGQLRERPEQAEPRRAEPMRAEPKRPTAPARAGTRCAWEPCQLAVDERAVGDAIARAPAALRRTLEAEDARLRASTAAVGADAAMPMRDWLTGEPTDVPPPPVWVLLPDVDPDDPHRRPRRGSERSGLFGAF